jgi:peptidoglycan/xylan/chitin deacetylase (PgdA/CDA1 family)
MKKFILFKLLLFLAVPVFGEVTFSFDDGSRTQVNNGYPILFKYHYPATIYLETKPLGHDDFFMDWGDVKTLDLAGWDIEAHTYSHKDLTTIPLSQVRKELDKSIQDLRWHGYNAKHFAAPYGAINPQVLALVKKRFVSNRAAWVQGNELNWENHLNRYNLSVLPLNEKTDMWLVERCIEHATFEKRYLIFMIHRVVKDPKECKDDYCISTEKLQKVVEYCRNQGTKVVTVDEYFKLHKLEK